jgi:hypothetical protein
MGSRDFARTDTRWMAANADVPSSRVGFRVGRLPSRLPAWMASAIQGGLSFNGTNEMPSNNCSSAAPRSKRISLQAGDPIESLSGTIIPPIFPSITFRRSGGPSYIDGYSHSRVANPTVHAAAETLLFGSGMAAAITSGRLGNNLDLAIAVATRS